MFREDGSDFCQDMFEAAFICLEPMMACILDGRGLTGAHLVIGAGKRDRRITKSVHRAAASCSQIRRNAKERHLESG